MVASGLLTLNTVVVAVFARIDLSLVVGADGAVINLTALFDALSMNAIAEECVLGGLS
jgi:hypothetical protein